MASDRRDGAAAAGSAGGSNSQLVTRHPPAALTARRDDADRDEHDPARLAGSGQFVSTHPDLVSDGDGATGAQERGRHGRRSPDRGKKGLIEWAYRWAEPAGIPVWCQDEAGPYQTVPYPGASWQPEGNPLRQPHEYVRAGTAKLLTLFRPATGEVRGKGVTSSRQCRPASVAAGGTDRDPRGLARRARGGSGATAGGTMGDLARARTARPFAAAAADPGLGQPRRAPELGDRALAVPAWRDAVVHPVVGIMAEHGRSRCNGSSCGGRWRVSIPQTPAEIIGWLEETVAGWNEAPTPFVWGGKRQARRERARQRRIGGSAACLPEHQLFAA